MRQSIFNTKWKKSTATIGPLSRASSLLNFVALLSLSLCILFFLSTGIRISVCVRTAYHIYLKQRCFNIHISCIPVISNSVEEQLNAEREKTRQIYYKDWIDKGEKKLIAQQHIILLSQMAIFFSMF